MAAASSPAYPRSSTPSTRRWWSPRASASGSPSSARAAAAIFAIEFGNGALVDSLPGVPGGSSYVGSFDREEAVEDETIDFFASGHPLVEGIFAHFEDSALGRVARFEVEIGRERGEGLVAIYKDGPVSRSSRSTPPVEPGRTGRRRSASGRSARAA